MMESTLLVQGLSYAESPRWRNGDLFVSDVHAYAVKVVAGDGRIRTLCEIPGRPAGLGFLPDGRLLIASARDQCLWAWNGAQIALVADLSSLATGLLNDMVVDRTGRAYVGDTAGTGLLNGEPAGAGQVLTWQEGSKPEVAVSEVDFPNGSAISADGSTFYLSETTARRISSFAIGSNGRLTRQRTVVQLDGLTDGLCLDGGGGLWVALLTEGRFVHVSSDGELTDSIDCAGRLAVACTLGGPDRKTLFLCSAATTLPELMQGRSSGLIHTAKVAVEGAGLP